LKLICSNRLELLREVRSTATSRRATSARVGARKQFLSSKHKTDCRTKSNSPAVLLIRQVLLARCVSLAGRGRAKAVRAKGAARLRPIWID
jgi:hypothetical protein